MRCQICYSKVTPRFSTKRLVICQKCINIISGQAVNIEVLKKSLFDIIERNFSYPDDDYIHKIAKTRMSAEEGGVATFFSSLFNTVSYKKFYENAKKSCYNKVDVLRSKKFSEFIRNEYVPLTDYFFSNRKRGIYVSGEKPALEDWEKVFLKLYRACLLHILSENGELCGRPTDEEWLLKRQHIINDDNYTCCKCGKKYGDAEFHVHHIIPVAKYGTNHINNLVLLCRTCHQKQHLDFKISKNVEAPKKRETKKPREENSSLTKKTFSSQTKKDGISEDKNSPKQINKNFPFYHCDNEQNLDVNHCIDIDCPSCGKKHTIPCGEWIYVYCDRCYHEFYIKGFYQEKRTIENRRQQTVMISCPSCQQTLRVLLPSYPVSIKCPTCNTVFQYSSNN